MELIIVMMRGDMMTLYTDCSCHHQARKNIQQLLQSMAWTQDLEQFEGNKTRKLTFLADLLLANSKWVSFLLRQDLSG